MAKSARARSVKVNNRALKAKVFGPVEDARTARLSAKLMELASQPKPQRDVKMDEEAAGTAEAPAEEADAATADDTMDLDSGFKGGKSAGGKKRVEKRRVKKRSSILFPNKFGDQKKKRK